MRSNTLFLRLISCAALMLTLCGAGLAQSVPSQVDPNNLTGTMPYNTYGGGRENINLATGDLHLAIPLASLPGRNGHNFSLGMIYDSKMWTLHYENDPGGSSTWWETDTTSGWRSNIPTLVSSSVTYGNPLHPGLCQGAFIVTLSDGSKHPFSTNVPSYGARTNCILGSNPDPGAEILQYSTNDGSFLTIDISNLSDIVVYEKNGVRLHFGNPGTGGLNAVPAFRIDDTNGNEITIGYSGIIDTVGRSINWTTTNGQNTVTTTVTYKDSGGNSQTATLNYNKVNLQPTFVNPQGATGSAAGYAELASIVLPTGRAYTFVYDNGATTFGELTKITYPTGGYTRYDYGLFTALHVSSGYAAAADFREVVARHVCRDVGGACSPSTEDTTTYTPTVDGNKINNQYEDVTDPAGNRTRSLFSCTGPPGSFSPRELSRSIYSGSSTLLRTIQTDYNLTQNGTPTNASLPIRKTTTLYDVSPNLVTKTEWDYDPSGLTDNVIAQREYDYSSGTPPLLRQTIRTWLTTNPVNGVDYTALPLHILDRKLTENVQDASGSNFSQIKYEYDNYGTISASGAVQHNSALGPAYTTRGNVTKIQRWRNSDGAWLATTNTYDDAGNILSTTAPSNSPYDSFNRTTTFSYADSWGNATCTPSGGNGAAYITSVSNALGQTAHYTYNSCTGTMASATDANSQQTTFNYDLLARLSQTNYPDGGQTTDCYSDIPGASCYTTGQLSLTRTDKITGTLNESPKILVDGIGNVIQTQLTTDPDGTDYTDIAYDSLERKASVSNPHRATSSSTDGTTQYTYDALSRVTLLLQPDGSQVSTSYVGNQTTVTDETGKKRTSQTDGVGRLTTVWEDPGAAPHSNYETDYQYDVFGNLIRVDQHGGDPNSGNWRTRTFAYNSLAQLLCAANPEIALVTCPNPDNGSYTTGTLRYGYDNEGNVLTKTAPKPNQTGSTTVVTSYSYDALNRLMQKSYNDGTTPTVKYGLDGVALSGCTPAPPALTDSYPIGRSTSMCDGSGATSWSHEQMGRVAAESRTIVGSTNITKTITYAPYNLDGSLANVTYPSGRIITYAPGGAGRPLSAIEAAHSINYVTNATYAPPGELYQFSNGSSLAGALTYNSRLQPLQLYFTTGTISSGTLTQLQQAPCPTTAATVMSRSYNLGAGTNDNGTVQTMNDCLNPDRTQNFDYDNLNRLADAYTTGTGTTSTNWGEVYTIDPWGNLTNIAVKPGWHNSESLNAAAASAQNQLNGFCNDAAGNMTGSPPCPGSTYTYDAENRLTATNGYTYRYDGDGQRVIKCNGTYPTCSSGTLYWTGTGSDALAETSWTGAAVEEYVFFGGKRVARRDGTGSTVHYYFGDHLGSTSVITSATGAIQKSSVYYPYGGEIAVTGPNFANNYKFTGKERDAESNLDNFGARYYASFGRFMTPDWSARPTTVPYAVFGDPQSLNLYSYVRNDPVSRADADGHDINDWKCDFNPFDTRGVWAKLYGAASASVEAAAMTQNLEAAAMAQNTLSAASVQAILNSPLNSRQAEAFEDAVLGAGAKTGVDPNILVGMAFKESTLGANMNPNGAAKGLYGVEKSQMKQINKMFKLGLKTSDLKSLSAGSMAKVSLGVASYIQHYSGIYSNSADPRGVDVGISAWRVGIGQTRANIRQGNFWDYVDPHLHESVANYVDAVEGYQ